MKRKKGGIAYIVFYIAMFYTPYSFAHGIEGTSEGPGGEVIRAVYDDGEAMSYAKVIISAPDSNMVFQTGGSDRNGRFCFYPDVPGIWKVVMEDGIGHRLEMMVDVDNVQKAQIRQPESAGLNKMSKVLLGISIIFLITSVFLWLNAKKISLKTTGKQQQIKK